MHLVEELIGRLEKINTSELINTSVLKNEQQILQANTEDQLFNRGIDITGRKMVPPYAKSTVKHKIRVGLPSAFVTLYEIGTLHGNFKVRTFPDMFTIGLDLVELVRGFDLASHLRERYGKFEGLTDKNFVNIIGKRVLPDVANSIANVIWMH